MTKSRALNEEALESAGTSKVPALVKVVEAVVAVKVPYSRAMAPLLVTLMVGWMMAPSSTVRV